MEDEKFIVSRVFGCWFSSQQVTFGSDQDYKTLADIGVWHIVDDRWGARLDPVSFRLPPRPPPL